MLHYKIVDRSLTSNLFLEFLEECLENRIFNRNKTLAIDNAKICHIQEVTDFFHNNLLHCQYLSTYAPQLNPNEEVFSIIRQKYYQEILFAQIFQQIRKYVSDGIDDINKDKSIIFSFSYDYMDIFL